MIVFVSYSSINRERVEALVIQLGALGHDVEYEVKIVGGPITWRHVISSIKECDLFVAALTPASLASYTCEIEHQYAQSLGKNILPVLLEDISILGQNVEPVVDFRTDSVDTQSALANAIAALPAPQPISSKASASADWISPLAELRQRIEGMSRKDDEQQTLLLNVKEFLERRESFEIARSLLDLLAANPRLKKSTAAEITVIRDELNKVRTSTRVARQQRTIAGAVALSLLVAVVAFILSQLFFRFRSERTATLVLTSTAESVFAAQVIASLTPPTATYTVTPSATSVPSATALPSATATILLATNTLIPSTDTPTNLPSTATPLPTLTATSTSLPPTLTSTFTATPIPASNTPLPTLTFTPTASPSPTQGLSFMSTSTPRVDLTNMLPQTVYIGIDVEDTPLGLLVKSVGSTAQSAGVQEGDYVLAVDLDVVTTRTQFLDVMQTRNPFSRVTLRVRRGGGIQILTFVLGASDFNLRTPSP